MASRIASISACEAPPKSGGAKWSVTQSKPRRSSSVDGAVAGSTAEGQFEMAACLARVRQRDEDAARLLLNHLYPLVMKLVRSHLPRRTSEEDLAQVVFMKIFSKI